MFVFSRFIDKQYFAASTWRCPIIFNTSPRLWATKATILDELGRKEEADALRSRFEGVEATEHDDIYQRFHERLTEFSL